ncbi:MAG: tetratricopeptide repeat protein [Rhodobiaceae bacterium]|nr:tetratricopeptide repeat protein [Rhodobiaceae bacterium]MCC0018824.1 tetratricopeptide repeat protein [Rhodobiaceae bacterium]MCC0050676.1 tetratricopeptide repeat protein [Rhodobiaceae bacterium]MCC0059879.1 tetratricopeptide repeat protein [Rhodobiaceae bacterium]
MAIARKGVSRVHACKGFRLTLAAGILAFSVAHIPATFASESDGPVPSRSFVGNYLAGRFAAQERDKDAAALFLGAALQQSPEDPSLIDQAFVASLSAGKFEDAVENAKALLKIDGDNRLARIAVAADALRGRQYAQVSKIMEAGFENPLAKITGTFIHAWSEMGAGHKPEALSLVDKMDDLGNGDLRRIKDYTYGMLAEFSGQNDVALSAYERAYEVAPGNVRIVEALARMSARAGDFDHARELAQEYEQRAPGHPLMTRILASVAEKRVPPSPATTPQAGAAETIFTIGSALGRDASDEMAVMFYQMALLLQPDAPLPLSGLAGYFDAVEDYDAALATLDRMPADAPQYISTQVSKARILDKTKHTDEALEILDSLAIASPGREVFLARASILHGQKRYLDAADAYSRAIAATGEVRDADWYLFYYRGMVRERAKQWTRAEQDFKRALKLNPEQPNVLNYLGYSWIDQGLNLDEALKLVKRAVELRPKDGDIVDSLGWAYYRLGRYEESVKTLERAIELRPEEPVIHDHLGDAYWKVGRKFEAHFQWQHALDIKPDDAELVTAIEAKMKDGLPDEPEQKAAKAGD